MTEYIKEGFFEMGYSKGIFGNNEVHIILPVAMGYVSYPNNMKQVTYTPFTFEMKQTLPDGKEEIRILINHVKRRLMEKVAMAILEKKVVFFLEDGKPNVRNIDGLFIGELPPSHLK